jgi:hypothetical protein
METRTYDFGTFRFHWRIASFPPRFPDRHMMCIFCFPLVSCWFPFVSRFAPYMRETRNEAHRNCLPSFGHNSRHGVD